MRTNVTKETNKNDQLKLPAAAASSQKSTAAVKPPLSGNIFSVDVTTSIKRQKLFINFISKLFVLNELIISKFNN